MAGGGGEGEGGEASIWGWEGGEGSRWGWEAIRLVFVTDSSRVAIWQPPQLYNSLGTGGGGRGERERERGEGGKESRER